MEATVSSAAQRTAEALTLLTVCTSQTSPHSCVGEELEREGWGSFNQLLGDLNGSVHVLEVLLSTNDGMNDLYLLLRDKK